MNDKTMRKSNFRKIVLIITISLLLSTIVLITIPSNSIFFEQKPIENQQELGYKILEVFKNKFKSTDTIFLAKKRTFNLDCGTGVKSNYIDDLKNKYFKITHRNIIYIDNLFVKPLAETDKLVVTEIVTYTNEQFPNDNDLMIVHGNTINGLKSKKKKVFLLNFDSIDSDKVDVSFTDYLKKSVVLHLTFVLENKKWKIASTNLDN